MRTIMIKLREYLAENKKVYSFNIKVAGEVPAGFVEDVKKKVAKYEVASFEKLKSTPIQKELSEFPNVSNAEVTTFNIVLEYPITSPELTNCIKEIGLNEEYFLVRGSSEPGEIDEKTKQDSKGEVLLTKKELEEPAEKAKDLAGPEFNKGFLADLAKAAEERKKELNNPTDPDVLGTHAKESKESGGKSPIGSK